MSLQCTDQERLTGWCTALAGESLEERRSDLLWRYVRSQLEPGIAGEIEQHLAACEGCRETFEGERLLAGMKKPGRVVVASCPSNLEMLQYLERDAALGPFRRLEIKTHLQKCELCREESAWAERTVAAPAPPAEPEQAAAPWWTLRWIYGMAAAAATVAVIAAVILAYPYQFGSRRMARYAVIPDFSYDQVLTEFGSRHPEDLPRFEEAALQVKLGGYQEGGTILNELQGKYSNDPSIAFFKGYIAVREGRWEEATLLCTKAESNNLHGFRCWYLANVALKAGKLDIARQELRHARGHREYHDRVVRLEQMLN